MTKKYAILAGCISMAAAQAAAIEYRATYVNMPLGNSGFSTIHASDYGRLLGSVRPPLS